MKAWAQEFTDKGIYVFADSSDSSKLTVVAVKAAEESCKDPDAPVQSMTAASLSAVGVESQAMILAAQDGDSLFVLSPDGFPSAGAVVS